MSTLTRLLPLIAFVLAVVLAAFVAYHIYLAVQAIANQGKQKFESKYVTVSKDGVKVGVKEVSSESYVDRTQQYFVKAWNLSTWPAYKSRFWNRNAPINQHGSQSDPRGDYHRTASSTSVSVN